MDKPGTHIMPSPEADKAHTDLPVKPSILGEVAFVIQDPEFTIRDRIEYLAHWLVAITLPVLSILSIISFIRLITGYLVAPNPFLFIFGTLGIVLAIQWHYKNDFGRRFRNDYYRSIGGKEFAERMQKRAWRPPKHIIMSDFLHRIWFIIWSILILFGFVLIIFILGVGLLSTILR